MSKEPSIKTSGVLLAKPEDTIEACLDRMAQSNVGSILVLEDDAITGILTERDVLRRWRSLGEPNTRSAPIASIMSTPVHTVSLDKLAETPQIMMDRRIRHLPMVDDDGKLTGILSMRDVLTARIQAASAPPAKLKIDGPASLHMLTPGQDLISLSKKHLPPNWTERIWLNIPSIENLPGIKEGTSMKNEAFLLDLDGVRDANWKDLIKTLIQRNTKPDPPSVFVVWSPGAINDREVVNLMKVAEKVHWHAYHRPLPLAELLADIRAL